MFKIIKIMKLNQFEIYIPSSNYKLLEKSEDVEIQYNLMDLS